MFGIGKSRETESRFVVALGRVHGSGVGKGKWKVAANGYMVSSGGDENVLI